MVPLKLSWTQKQIALLTVVPRSHCGSKTVISNVVFARVSFTAYYYLWKYPRCRSFLPENDRLSTCYFFLCYRDLCLVFFFVTVPHHCASLFASSSSLLTVHCTPLFCCYFPHWTAVDRHTACRFW